MDDASAFVAKDGGEEIWNGVFFGELEVGTTDTGGSYADMAFIVTELVVEFNVFELEWGFC